VSDLHSSERIAVAGCAMIGCVVGRLIELAGAPWWAVWAGLIAGTFAAMRWLDRRDRRGRTTP
jgi:hypothetical protein